MTVGFSEPDSSQISSWLQQEQMVIKTRFLLFSAYLFLGRSTQYNRIRKEAIFIHHAH